MAVATGGNRKAAAREGSRLSVWGMAAGLFGAVEDFKHADGRRGDACAGAEDGGHSRTIEVVVVLGGDDTAGGDHDVVAAKFLQLLDNLGHEGLVACGEG